jgi:hypothetical protein
MDEKESMILGPAGLYKLVAHAVKPWRTPNGDVFVDLWMDDIRHTVPVKSEAFTGILYMLAARGAPGKLPSAKALEEMKAFCIGTALASQRILPAFVRVGGTSGDLYYDFGDDTREMTRWRGGKWETVRTTGEVPRFYRPNGMLPQVRPQGGGDLLALLRKHVRCKEDDLYLLAAWLVGSFKVGGPFPVLIINGEQGSSKSTTTRLLRRLVDPHARDMREPPSNSRDLVAAVKNAYVVAVDNVSTLQHNLSDSLCRISTGTGALGGRRPSRRVGPSCSTASPPSRSARTSYPVVSTWSCRLFPPGIAWTTTPSGTNSRWTCPSCWGPSSTAWARHKRASPP